MKPIFKNARILVFATTLGTSCFGIVNAQTAPAKDPKVNSSTKESNSNIGTILMKADEPQKNPQEKPLVDQLNRRMSMVTEEGKFKTEYNSITEAIDAANGNWGNKTLKDGNEIIVMNSRCGVGNEIVPVTFSIYQLDGHTRENAKDLSPIIDAYLEGTKLDKAYEKKNYQQMVDKVVKILAVSRFPQKAACDPVPVALSFNDLSAARLELDDLQNPLIGPKYNNGWLYEGLRSNSRLMATPEAKTKAFWEKYGYNNFSTLNDAASTASVLGGTKAVIFNGKTFSIYRLKPQNFTNNADGNMNFDALKTTPMPNGWKIIMVVSGSKFIKIYDPASN